MTPRPDPIKTAMLADDADNAVYEWLAAEFDDPEEEEEEPTDQPEA